MFGRFHEYVTFIECERNEPVSLGKLKRRVAWQGNWPKNKLDTIQRYRYGCTRLLIRLGWAWAGFWIPWCTLVGSHQIVIPRSGDVE